MLMLSIYKIIGEAVISYRDIGKPALYTCVTYREKYQSNFDRSISNDYSLNFGLL